MADIQGTARYCGHCGKSLDDRYCKTCGSDSEGQKESDLAAGTQAVSDSGQRIGHSAATDLGSVQSGPSVEVDAPSSTPVLRRRSTLIMGSIVVLGVAALVILVFLAGQTDESSAQDHLEQAVVDCGVTSDYSTEMPTDGGEILFAPQLNIELFGDSEMFAGTDRIDCVAKALMSDSAYIKFQSASADYPLRITENGLFIHFQFDSIAEHLWLSVSLDD